jgi:predicted nucleic acid-binding protein
LPLICDTGPLLAALDRDDADHLRCSELLESTSQDLVVPTLVLGELDYWCGKIGLDQAWLTFLEDVERGAWRLEHPSLEDLHRARQLQQTYRDMRLGVVDATVIALAERLGEEKVVTLDHRHFATVRPQHVASLTLLP